MPGLSLAQKVTITPGYLDVAPGQKVQYAAAVTGLANRAVTWEVSEIVGGTAALGRITAAGVYTAPLAVPSSGVTITAIASDRKTSASVYVNVAGVGPTLQSFSPNPVYIGTYTMTLTGSGFKRGMVVMAGGVDLQTTYVNSSKATVVGWQAAVGTVAFQAKNPGTLLGPALAIAFKSKTPQAISPAVLTLPLGGKEQFVSDGATSWTANVGTITTGGRYTAPAKMPLMHTALITATGNDGAAVATVTLVVPQTISPVSASVKLGATQQFSSPGATNWTASSGTISAKGLFTASMTRPASGTATITAKGPGGSASAIVKLIAPQAVAPLTASVMLGKTQQFTSAGATSWKATAGTITSAGFYTAPAVMPVSKGVTVTATGSGGSASATVTLVGTQVISPVTVSLALGKSQQFTSAGATSWSASAGTITSTGLYTAPGTAISSGMVTITATGAGGSATAKVTLPSTQTISPTSASIYLGATQLFVSPGATSWTATAGTILAGVYVAPLVMPASGSATITATGAGGSASATVSLLGTQTILPTSVSLALGGKQQFVSVGATSWTASAGTITSTGLYTAPATAPSVSITVTASGPGGSASASVTLPSSSLMVSSVAGGTLPLGIFSTTIGGAGFTSASVASINGVALRTTYKSASSLAISGFSGTAGTASLTVSNGSATSAPLLVTVGVANPLASPSAARRFLEQGAFGPTPTDAAHVQTIGEAAWITEQLKMAQVSNYSSITTDQDGMPNHFLTNAVMNSDQLRQRVAFALSQIFVTSLDKIIWNSNMILFQNMLLADAFTNYRQIMADVTLSPAMGQYLDMANNAAADPTIGSAANENYARELMQLFTIGTNALNADGSTQLDANGLPIPNYVQSNISEFARVYTGWTYAPGAGTPVEWGAYITSNGPMVPYTPEHDFGSKQLLYGVTSPAGVTPLQDLNNALDSIFSSPSIAPFVSKQLIQHLVKSNPSPAYVARVSAAFNNNGKGVKGDMQAVITAILMDPEARANDAGGKDLPTDGHLQEPALFIAGMVRAFGGQMTDENYYADELAEMGQDLFSSPSVFNYYAPNYMVPGTALLGPEFQINTPNNALVRVNEVSTLMYSEWADSVQDNGPGTTVDLTPYVPLTTNISTLIDALDLTLTHGTMPTAMKAAIVTAVSAEDQGSLRQVQTACYLILTSNYYNVWH
ncbi:DUF1800 family protein [Granulicella sibirica]|uniref:DUF1800 family protein n=1 Tax=Granulicella sibirica TaxID=2479048 RepID=UPI0013760BFD|nr:DUF1800 family protein [Granulicella sibirica]